MDTFENYRPMLFGIAYRMLGSAMEAEDVVQDAYLRYQATPPDNIRSPKAFLGTVVTRLCLDQLKSAQAQRETYIGTWLPEPLVTNDTTSPIERDSISMAFLVLLESLTPSERAVFLLHEVFDYEYAEIAEIVGKEETACRQLLHRAKKHIADHRPRFKSTQEEHQEMLLKFTMAVAEGDLNGLTSLLAENVTSWSDGGGKSKAALRPIYGRDNVARLVLSIARQITQEMSFEIALLNGKPSIVCRINDEPKNVIMLEVGDGLIQQLRFILNPDKLKRI